MDHKLLTSQKNDVFVHVANAGLKPADFHWGTNKSPWTHRTDPAIVHTLSGFYFGFHVAHGEHCAEYVPGVEQRVAERTHTGNWKFLLDRLDEWLEIVRREAEQPDLWGELEHQAELGAAPGERVENTPFTATEQAQIAEQLGELKEYVRRTHELTPAQYQALASGFDYLREAAGRMGRIDWRNTLMGVLLGAVVQASVPPEAVRDVIGFALRGLANVFGADIPELPAGPPMIV